MAFANSEGGTVLLGVTQKGRSPASCSWRTPTAALQRGAGTSAGRWCARSGSRSRTGPGWPWRSRCRAAPSCTPWPTAGCWSAPAAGNQALDGAADQPPGGQQGQRRLRDRDRGRRHPRRPGRRGDPGLPAAPRRSGWAATWGRAKTNPAPASARWTHDGAADRGRHAAVRQGAPGLHPAERPGLRALRRAPSRAAAAGCPATAGARSSTAPLARVIESAWSAAAAGDARRGRGARPAARGPHTSTRPSPCARRWSTPSATATTGRPGGASRSASSTTGWRSSAPAGCPATSRSTTSSTSTSRATRAWSTGSSSGATSRSWAWASTA